MSITNDISRCFSNNEVVLYHKVLNFVLCPEIKFANINHLFTKKHNSINDSGQTTFTIFHKMIESDKTPMNFQKMLQKYKMEFDINQLYYYNKIHYKPPPKKTIEFKQFYLSFAIKNKKWKFFDLMIEHEELNSLHLYIALFDYLNHTNLRPNKSIVNKILAHKYYEYISNLLKHLPPSIII